MPTKNDALLAHIINIKENVAGINQHLKDMNGKLVSQENRICSNDSRIDKIDKKLATWMGGIAVVLFIVNIVISVVI